MAEKQFSKAFIHKTEEKRNNFFFINKNYSKNFIIKNYQKLFHSSNCTWTVQLRNFFLPVHED